MGRKSRDSYEDALGLREVETIHADTFEAEFPVVTGRPVEILSEGESPDRIALIAGVETGIELTAIHAGSAGDIVAEMIRLATQKHQSYERRGIFYGRPITLLGHLDWPARDVEGPALYDVYEELEHPVAAGDFDDLGFFAAWQFPAVDRIFLFCLIFYKDGRVMSPAGKTFQNVFLYVYGRDSMILDEPVSLQNKKVTGQVRCYIDTVHLCGVTRTS